MSDLLKKLENLTPEQRSELKEALKDKGDTDLSDLRDGLLKLSAEIETLKGGKKDVDKKDQNKKSWLDELFSTN